MSNYYMILTSVGIAKLINATLTSVPLDITHMAVGDSGGSHYSPTQSATVLKNEVWRGTVHLVEQSTDNPNWIVVEAVIPTTVGGFTARELGLIDAEGDLIAIGKIPETYKPIMEEGSAKDLYLKAIIEASNASSVVMKVDPSSVIANRKYVDDKIQIVSTNLTSLETRLTEHLDQDVSNGVHGMGSAAAQIYEDGLWTPKLDTINTLYSLQQGTYTRIGNKVFIQAQLSLTSKGTDPGKLSISGIPYVGKNPTLALIRIIASGLADPNKKINGLVGGLNKIGIYSESNSSLTSGASQLSIEDITDNTNLIVVGYYSI